MKLWQKILMWVSIGIVLIGIAFVIYGSWYAKYN